MAEVGVWVGLAYEGPLRGAVVKEGWKQLMSIDKIDMFQYTVTGNV